MIPSVARHGRCRVSGSVRVALKHGPLIDSLVPRNGGCFHLYTFYFLLVILGIDDPRSMLFGNALQLVLHRVSQRLRRCKLSLRSKASPRQWRRLFRLSFRAAVCSLGALVLCW